MYQVEDEPTTTEPIERYHLYVVREEPARPSIAPIVLSLVTLTLFILYSALTPYQQPEIRTAIRVPAVPAFVKTFSATVKIAPTGVKNYPATYAHGALTFTNGSVIGQSIPAGFVVRGVATDEAVYVPGATADGFGTATVSAHELTAGVNLPKLAINEVIGTSLFIRNLQPFSGGQPAYSVKYTTLADRQRAVEQARNQLAATVTGLHYPCQETKYTAINKDMYISWHCQFVTYHLPSYMHISNVQLIGTHVIVNVWFVEHPKHIWVK